MKLGTSNVPLRSVPIKEALDRVAAAQQADAAPVQPLITSPRTVLSAASTFRPMSKTPPTLIPCSSIRSAGGQDGAARARLRQSVEQDRPCDRRQRAAGANRPDAAAGDVEGDGVRTAGRVRRLDGLAQRARSGRVHVPSSVSSTLLTVKVAAGAAGGAVAGRTGSRRMSTDQGSAAGEGGWRRRAFLVDQDALIMPPGVSIRLSRRRSARPYLARTA